MKMMVIVFVLTCVFIVGCGTSERTNTQGVVDQITEMHDMDVLVVNVSDIINMDTKHSHVTYILQGEILYGIDFGEIKLLSETGETVRLELPEPVVKRTRVNRDDEQKSRIWKSSKGWFIKDSMLRRMEDEVQDVAQARVVQLAEKNKPEHVKLAKEQVELLLTNMFPAKQVEIARWK